MSSVTGTVIMSRLVTDDGQQVVIEVGAPTPAETGADCVFRIDDHVFHSRGADELAALHTAIVEIGQTPAQANRDAERARFALPAELGFPDPTPTDTTIPAGPDTTMSDIVAQRTIDHDGRAHTVILGRPFRSPDHQLALCPFRVDDRPRAVAAGWDGMQAFLNAVGMIGSWLNLPLDWPSTTAP
ncbi:DUF6968 family protein [Nocardia sp. R7R-8]|uniref:DUF6968 family protein n=1 Tax=Nocardia sp. R7R-8 TaxID=3459304 RepID=UPI00403D8DAA